MNKIITDHFNTIVQEVGFLQDNAAELAPVTQIAAKTILLEAKLEELTLQAAKGDRDLSGYTEDKNDKRINVRGLMYKVSRGNAAYYLSIGNKQLWREADPQGSEFDRMNDAILYTTSVEIYNSALPNAALLIGANAGDVTALNAASAAFIGVLRDPQREIQISAEANASLATIVHEANAIADEIDVYMQTFAAVNPTLYNLWVRARAIYDSPTHGEPDLTTPPISCGGLGVVTTIDFAPIVGEFTGSTNIKFFLPDIVGQGMSAGFGPNANTILAELPLVPGANNRVSAASLGYDINAARFLNVRNTTPGAVMVMVGFYLQD